MALTALLPTASTHTRVRARSTALFTPFEVAFLPAFTDARRGARRASSSTASLTCTSSSTSSSSSSSLCAQAGRRNPNAKAGEIWEDRRRAIAMLLTSGWFFFDLFTLLPSLVDVIPTFRPGEVRVLARRASAGNSSILRTPRDALRQALPRRARGAPAQRWASRVTLTYSTLTLLRCIGTAHLGPLVRVHLRAAGLTPQRRAARAPRAPSGIPSPPAAPTAPPRAPTATATDVDGAAVLRLLPVGVGGTGASVPMP